jgi:3-hydroxybutyryl-CoA dehydrogenase
MDKLHLITTESALADCGAPVLLEVIFEDLKLKIETFERIGKIMPQDTVFWTNTSCLDVEKMADASGRPQSFIGTHGMNPVHLMTGVEVVKHPKLSREVLDLTLAVLKKVGKDPFVTDNVPGFIVNNGLIPWMIHYALMLERRQASTEDIDKALKSSLGHPQGVFMLTDFVGINTTILVAEELHAATLDPRYIAPPLLYKMRDAGWDGFKTGRGFYDWSDRKNPRPIPFEELTKPKS